MEDAINVKESVELDLLSAVENIVEMAQDSQLSPAFFDKVIAYTDYMGDILNLTRDQCVLLALFIDKSGEHQIETKDITEYTGCRTTRIIRYLKDIDVLVRRGFIIRCHSITVNYYRVPTMVVDAFRMDEAYTPKACSGLTCHELFEEFAEIIDRVEDNEMDKDTASESFKSLLEGNKQLLFVQKTLALFKGGLSTDEYDDALVLLIVFCHLFVNNSDDMIGYHDFENFFSKRDARHIKTELKRGVHFLQMKNIIESGNNNGMGSRENYRLTMTAKRELLDELQLPSLEGSRSLRSMINVADIKPRNLFYSDEITRRIDDLAGLLEEKNYTDIRSRLQQQGFRSGFTCLFYGAPGTGKTETVMQLARRTGRDIMQVNFAEMKSMWVGESEKNVKALFDTYRQRVKDSSIAPILLFNEADAIIGKRQEGAERAVEKMENSLQNIILQEMETLDGILIATTNLAQNMDKAFERRFLYKIHFDKPSAAARTAIWCEMLPELERADAAALAERYDFSGGQIENIARHYTIDAILHGTAKPDYATLLAHCDQERMERADNRRIGF
ncbi:MAG: ATP-binding protein [Bacteroidales bacterium]|nr:ATP-binding protein [Bacteroidales bacterium]